jgi:hypothetical protein
MRDVPTFNDIEIEIIKRMYDKRMPVRQISKMVDRTPLDVSDYINRVLAKTKPPVIIGQPRASSRAVSGVRRYDDVLAAAEGSRKLLEAVHKYFAKRQGETA